MTGKIDGLPPRPQNARTHTNPASTRRSANGWGRAQQNDTSVGDTVNLTDSAQTMQHMERTLANTPAIDHNRVDAIRQAIANGQYRVNSQRVADGLLRADQAMAKLKP